MVALGGYWNEFDVRILLNLAVHGQKRRIQDASCGDNYLVNRVAMKVARKLCGLDTNAWRKLDETDAWIRKCLLKPVEDGTRLSEPSALHEFGDLPARNRAYRNASLLGGIKQRTHGWGK